MPRKVKKPLRLTPDQLLEAVVSMMTNHIATAGDGDRFKAQAEALGTLMAAEHALHSMVCVGRHGQQECPRHPAHHIADAMLDDLHGALTRVFDATGYVQ